MTKLSWMIGLFACGLLFVGGSTAASAQDDIGSREDPVCCGADCCSIDTVCFGTGDTNPANECEMCDPASSQDAWTAIDGCGTTGGTDAGGGGDEGGDEDGGGCAAGGAGGAGAGVALLLLGLVRRRR